MWGRRDWGSQKSCSISIGMHSVGNAVGSGLGARDGSRVGRRVGWTVDGLGVVGLGVDGAGAGAVGWLTAGPSGATRTTSMIFTSTARSASAVCDSAAVQGRPCRAPRPTVIVGLSSFWGLAVGLAVGLAQVGSRVGQWRQARRLGLESMVQDRQSSAGLLG